VGGGGYLALLLGEVARGGVVDGADDGAQVELVGLGLHIRVEAVHVLAAVVGGDGHERVEVRQHLVGREWGEVGSEPNPMVLGLSPWRGGERVRGLRQTTQWCPRVTMRRRGEVAAGTGVGVLGFSRGDQGKSEKWAV
jgi:hypothetical protein